MPICNKLEHKLKQQELKKEYGEEVRGSKSLSEKCQGTRG